MATTDVTGWRIKIFIFCIVVVACVLVINMFFVGNLTSSEDALSDDFDEGVSSQGLNIFSLQTWIDAISFAYIPIDTIRWILGLFMGCFMLVTVYLGYTLIRDLLPW